MVMSHVIGNRQNESKWMTGSGEADNVNYSTHVSIRPRRRRLLDCHQSPRPETTVTVASLSIQIELKALLDVESDAPFVY